MLADRRGEPGIVHSNWDSALRTGGQSEHLSLVRDQRRMSEI